MTPVSITILAAIGSGSLFVIAGVLILAGVGWSCIAVGLSLLGFAALLRRGLLAK